MNKLKFSLVCGLLSFCGLNADVLPFAPDYNNGLLPRSSISYSTGWRCDNFSSTEFFILEDGSSDGYGKEKLRDINVWEVGLQWTLATPSCFSECGGDWLSQFYLDGYAYWGTVGNGGTRSISFFTDDGVFDGSSKRNARAGSTYDYQIALGWLYPISCEFGLAPKVGYSWDKQIVRPSTLISFETGDLPSISIGQHSEITWNGPFLGFELVYDLCDFRFTGGYEYHWVKAEHKLVNNRFLIDPENCVVRSFTARKNGSHGQVGYLAATYEINDCWALKLQGKYRNFDAGTARYKDSDPIPLDCGFSDTKHNWNSWEITFDLAYQF